VKTTAWTAPDARRWWQWVGPWPLLPLIDGIFAAGLAFAARSESITRDTALSEIAIAVAYGVIVGVIIAASRRWLTEFAESGLGYIATIIFAVLVGNAFRDSQGVVLDYPAQPAWIDFTIAVSRSVIAIVILQAIVGALQTRLQQQVTTTSATLDVVEQQAEALLRADEEVRSSVASLLHDRVQGGLLAACLRLQAVPDQEPSTRQEIDSIIGDLERLRALDVRRAVRTLSPSLRDIDLESAIREMVEPFQPAIDVSIAMPREVPDDPSIRLGAYRIIEQGLLNAIDHGRAHRVDITVTRAPDQLEITVRDDGAGLDAGHRSGFGMTLVDTWCRTLGGDWELRDADGVGTVLIAHLPVHDDS
jgi:signal transduction histidine kinase